MEPEQPVEVVSNGLTKYATNYWEDWINLWKIWIPGDVCFFPPPLLQQRFATVPRCAPTDRRHDDCTIRSPLLPARRSIQCAMCTVHLPPHLQAFVFALPLWARLPANHAISFVYVCILSIMRGASDDADDVVIVADDKPLRKANLRTWPSGAGAGGVTSPKAAAALAKQASAISSAATKEDK